MIPQGMSPERQPLALNPLGLSGCDCGMRIVGARGRVPDSGARLSAFIPPARDREVWY